MEQSTYINQMIHSMRIYKKLNRPMEIRTKEKLNSAIRTLEDHSIKIACPLEKHSILSSSPEAADRYHDAPRSKCELLNSIEIPGKLQNTKGIPNLCFMSLDFTAFKMNSLIPSLVASFALACSLNCNRLMADDWPHWRGPNGLGSTPTGSPPAQWTAESIKWKVSLPGKGTSVPIVHQKVIYITSPAEKEDAVMAFDLDGNQLWQTKLGPENPPKHRTLASSCNASPVTDGKQIYVHFKSGNFAALDRQGKVQWKINLVEKYGSVQLFWDEGASPILTDDLVILPRLHSGESWVAAFKKKTGEVVWKHTRNFKVPNENDNGYTTPVLFNYKGKQAVLIWGADHLTAHDVATGVTLWTASGFNPDQTAYWPAIATPAVVGNIAIIPAGRDDRNQARMHGIKLNGSGDVSSTHRVWKREDTGVFVSTPTVYKDKVYLLRHKGQVVCLDPATGNTLWTGSFPEHRAPYYASPVIANGILYAAREDGTVLTAKIQDKFEFIAENSMNERIIASPVPVGNQLVIRGDQHLFLIAGNANALSK